ncbi:hypothetical protein [Methylobacterium durans]|nr:hypothetical protein [Methylobacterium durans]
MAVMRLAALMWLAATLGGASMEAPDGAAAPKGETAAKLAGLAGFVNLSCPDLRSDPERLKAVIHSLGYEMTDLERGTIRLSAHGYMEAYRRNVPESCARAAALFGQTGSVVPGLVVPR